MKRYFFLVLVVVNIIAYQYHEHKYSERTNEYLNDKLVSMKHQYVNVVNVFDSYAQLVFRNNIETDQLYQIIKYLPDSSEIQKEHIRSNLYNYLLPLYQDLKVNMYISELHFHLPNGRSFLRMHYPDKYGDKLFEHRPSIRQANIKQIKVRGFEKGKDDYAYRFVFPVIFKNEHFGSVEISMSMKGIIDYMKHMSQSEYCFMIKKLFFLDKVSAERKNNYEQSILGQWFLLDKAINYDYCTKTIASVLNELKKNKEYLLELENSNELAKSIKVNNNNYSVVFFPVKNVVNGNIASIFSIKNDPILKQFKISFITEILLTLMTTFSLVSFVYFLFFKNQMMKNKFHKLESLAEKKSDELHQFHKNEQREIIFFNIIKAINKKVLCNTPLDDILKFCVNRFMTLPSCIFSVISVNLDEQYLFFSNACEKFETDKKKICDTIFKLVKNSDNYTDRDPVIINDLSKIHEFSNYLDVFKEHQIRTIVFLPLIEEKSLKKMGYVIFFSARSECFDENERQLFLELAQSISFSISFNQTHKVIVDVEKKSQ